MVTVQTFQMGDSEAQILAALEQDGVVIIEKAIDPDLCQTVVDGLRPHFDHDGRDTMNEFNGFTTLRISAIPARVPESAPLFTHPLTLAAADRFLRPNCMNYTLGSTTAIEIWPGENAQLLHRDAHCYHFEIPGVELQISALWALTDFTAENGPTCVVPGSHRWPLGREAGPDDPVAEAVMPAGSLLLYLGNTFHGGGANRSDKPRIALVNTLVLGWLRQEENLFLTVPRAVAETLPQELQHLLGYRSHGLVGWYPEDPTAKSEDDIPPIIKLGDPCPDYRSS
ncbi:MAG: phytanoyl-CoA dioxygenase family protein [Pseudomonadota bacterium]